MFLILEIEFLFVTEKERNIASFSRNFCTVQISVHGIELDLVRFHTNCNRVFEAY